MTQSKPKVEIDHRDSLYFNKYKYKLAIAVLNIERVRYYKSYYEYVNRPNYWNAPTPSLPNKDELDRYFAWRTTVDKTQCIVRIEHGKLMVYSNDLKLLESSANSIAVWKDVKYTAAEFPEEDHVLQFVNPPKFNYRIYFRAKSVNEDFRKRIGDFIADQKTNGTNISLNGAMSSWLTRQPWSKNGIFYLRDSYYVDYCDDGFGTALLLMFGEQLNPRIYRLVQRTPVV